MKRLIGPIVVVAIALAGYFVWSATAHAPAEITPISDGRTLVTIGDKQVRATIADDVAERMQGLSGVISLTDEDGMLFVFQEDGKHGFWMKDMHIPIDIIWLDAQKRVIYVAQNVAPETYPQSFMPKSDARYVLEVPAGWAKRYNVEVGAVANW